MLSLKLLTWNLHNLLILLGIYKLIDVTKATLEILNIYNGYNNENKCVPYYFTIEKLFCIQIFFHESYVLEYDHTTHKCVDS